MNLNPIWVSVVIWGRVTEIFLVFVNIVVCCNGNCNTSVANVRVFISSTIL